MVLPVDRSHTGSPQLLKWFSFPYYIERAIVIKIDIKIIPITNARGIHSGENTQNHVILAPNSLQTNSTINNRPGNPTPPFTITLLDIEV